MKTLMTFALAILSVPLCWASVTILSPRDGASVSQQTELQRAYLAMSRAERLEVQTDETYRNALAAGGSEPAPITLAWSAEQPGPYTVSVRLNGTEVLSLTTDETSVEIDSLEIGTNYTWRVSSDEGADETTFVTANETPRLIGLPSVKNARDLGGYIGLQGCRVRQGRLFRTRAFNGDSSIKPAGDGSSVTNYGWQRIHEDDRLKFVDRFGVKNDIDLRYDNEVLSMTGSPLGSKVAWRHLPVNSYGSFGSPMSQTNFREIFRLCADPDEHGVVFHCSAGQDRTGAVAFELLALLGVDEESLYKDWEATMFWNNTIGFNVTNRFEELVELMNRRKGTTWAERAETYAKECGITREEIEDYREVMLEGYVRRPPDSRETATEWYVDGSRVLPSGDGTSVEKAFQTLVEAMTNEYLKSGHTVYVLPGTYDTGIMTVEQSKIVSSNRVVVPQGVRLASTQGAAKTFIVGAASPDPVENCYGNGPLAVRCVYLNNDSRLEGFTLTGGRVYCTGVAALTYGPSAGGGVSAQPSSVIADCVISNCVAVRGGGGDQGNYFRCLFSENRATQIGGHLNGDCNAFNSLFVKDLGGSYDVFIAPEAKATTSNVVMNCTFDKSLNQNIRASATGDANRAHIVNCILMAKPQQGNNKQDTPTAWYHNCFIGHAGTATDITIDPDCTVLGSTDQAAMLTYLGLGADFQPTSLDSWMVDKGSNELYTAYYPTNLETKGALDFAAAARVQHGRIDLGAYEADATKTYVTVNTAPGMTVEGVTPGVKTPILNGENLTYTLRRDFTGERLCSGFTVNGTFYDFDDYPDGWEHTVTGSGYLANEVVEPVFVDTTVFYVDAEKGKDSNKGYHPDCAKETLAAAMRDLPSGVLTVQAAAGWYTNGAMVVKANDTTSNRVIVAANVRLQGAGADKTFIVGAESPTPVDGCYGNGPYAIRCAMLRDGAVLAGFTLTNGHVTCTSTTAGDEAGGAATSTKYTYGTACVSALEDCIIRNCVAVQGGGTGGSLVSRRCRFLDNRATRYYGAASGGEFYNCFFDGNVATAHTILQPKMVNCTATANNTSNFARYWGGASNDDQPDNIVNCVILGPSRDATDYTACVFDKNQKTKPSEANRGVGSLVLTSDEMKLDADYRPLRRSLLKNAGSAALYDSTRAGETDLDGNPRLIGDKIDVGAWAVPRGTGAVIIFQ